MILDFNEFTESEIKFFECDLKFLNAKFPNKELQAQETKVSELRTQLEQEEKKLNKLKRK